MSLPLLLPYCVEPPELEAEGTTAWCPDLDLGLATDEDESLLLEADLGRCGGGADLWE
jgi:hypothetical protein